MMRFHFVFIFFLCGLSVIKEQFTYIKKKKRNSAFVDHVDYVHIATPTSIFGFRFKYWFSTIFLVINT